MRLIRAVVLVGVAAVCLLPAGSAAADDTSLREAGRSRDAQFERLGRETRQAFARWNESGHARRPARRLTRLLRRTRAEIDIVVAAVTREEPSSPGGATYKDKLLRALHVMDRAIAWDIRGIRAGTNKRVVRARRAFRRAARLHDRALRLEREAIDAIT